MKTANLQPILDAVRNIERQELAAALKAHGGKYSFPEDGEHPGIEFWDEFRGPKSGDVDAVSVLGDGTISIAITSEDKYSYEIESDDVYPGHLSAITAALPEPAKTI